jgi:hypothetical protein
MVRTPTSNRAARRWALRARGALARSSSTRAYSRSVRFIVTHATARMRQRPRVHATVIVDGRAGLVVATPHRPIGSDRGWHGVAIDLAASPESCSGLARLGRSCGNLPWRSVGRLVHRSVGSTGPAEDQKRR